MSKNAAAKSEQTAQHIAHHNFSNNDPEDLFAAGLLLLKNNKMCDAFFSFKKALQINPSRAEYLSYYGLCLAKVEKNATKAIPLCVRAVEKEFYNANLFCNLGKVYLLKGKRNEAFAAFKRGLSIDKKNREIIREIKKMGIRKKPLIPFLSRSHFLNHIAGLIRYRLLQK